MHRVYREMKAVPVHMAIKTIQAKIRQTIAQIDRERRKIEDKRCTKQENEVLVQRYRILEKELYNQWEREKYQRWTEWIKKLNVLDHNKATRTFYSERRSKSLEEEHMGPVVNGDGRISTTTKECLENWKSYYEKLYSRKTQEEEMEEEKEETWKKSAEINLKHQEVLDRDITIEEIVDA